MNIETNFESQMQKLTQRLKYRLTLGGNADKIFKRQAGLFWRLLIDLSPPKDRQKSSNRIKDSVSSRFKQMNESQASKTFGYAEKAGHGDVIWTGSSRFALYGIARDVDFRGASVGALEQLYWKRGTNRRTAARAKYSRGHGKQDVYVWQKITTDKDTVDALKKLMIDHLGRVKAGWVKAWDQCGKPGRQIGQWISKHVGIVDSDSNLQIGTSIPDHIGEMSAVAINRQVGVDMIKRSGLLESAARIRADRLAGDIKFAIEHPDKWHEREAQIDEELVS